MKEYQRKRACQESGGGGRGCSPAAPSWCDVTESFSPCFLTKDSVLRSVLIVWQITCQIGGSANPLTFKFHTPETTWGISVIIAANKPHVMLKSSIS